MATSGYFRPDDTKVPTSFQRISVEPWRQFSSIDIDLDQRLTIITGTNGTGKTTILSLIGTHFNWPVQLIGTPIMDEDGHLSFQQGNGIAATLSPMAFPAPIGPPPYAQETEFSRIGSLTYQNGKNSQLLVPENPTSPQLSVIYDDQQRVDGIFLNSHRSVSPFQQPEWIPAKFSPVQEILENYTNEIRTRYFHNVSHLQKSSMLLMKETLLAAAIFGEGNASVRSDEDARTVWHGFQDILRVLLPVNIGFQRLRAVPPEIILITDSGEFTVDALSGGLRAVFEVAWQIFLRSHDSDAFTVCMDEPENHLHPELQRTLIPNLLEAFPRVNFVLATHSPFVVRSHPDARVYGLGFDQDRRVTATQFDLTSKGLSPEDTLRDVLGLDSTKPAWAESKFNAIVSRFAAQAPSRDTVSTLKKELEEAGLSSEMPIALEVLVEQTDI